MQMESKHFSKHNSPINIRAPAVNTANIIIHIHPMYLEASETLLLLGLLFAAPFYLGR